jgi:major membrane immunogen (membrane-anchored lipoprotein)
MKSARSLTRMMLCTLVILAGAAPALLARKEKKKSQTQGELISCEMKFDLKGWSAFYKTAKGNGTITCDNGQSASTSIKAKGGGITFGKSDVINGTGKFSGARSIHELFGSYAQAEVHAGAGKSAAAQALTKGEVSLVLTGTGRGVDVGFAFGKFTLR